MTENIDPLDCFNKVPSMDFSDPTIRHDRVLVVDRTKFYVSSELLSIHSEYFNLMFNGEFKEKAQEEIELKDLNVEEFRNFLKFFYPVRVDINKENIGKLIDMSFRFLAFGSLDHCRLFIFEKFDSLDKLDLLELTIKYTLNDVQDKLHTFFGTPQRLPGTVTCKTGHTSTGKCISCSLTALSISTGYVLNESSFIYTNKDRILELTPEAQIFIFKSVLKNN